MPRKSIFRHKNKLLRMPLSREEYGRWSFVRRGAEWAFCLNKGGASASAAHAHLVVESRREAKMLLRPRYRKYAAFLDAVSAGYLTRLKAATGKTLSQDSLTPHVWRALLADVRVLPTDRAFQFMKYKFMEIPFCRKRVYPLLVDQYGRPVYADIGSTPLGWRGDRDLKRRKVKLIRRYKVDHSLEFFFNRLRSRELARRRLVFCRSYRLFDAAHRLYPGGVRVATTHKALWLSKYRIRAAVTRDMIARRLDAWVVRAQAAMAPRGKQRRLFLRAAAGVLASAPRARRFSSFIRSRFSRTRAWALKAILTFAKRGVVGRGSAIRYAARLAERVVLARALSARNSPFVSLSHFNKIFKVLDTLALSRLHDGISSLEWGAIATRAGKTNVFLSKNLFWWRHSYRARYRSARWLQRVLKLWFKLDFRGWVAAEQRMVSSFFVWTRKDDMRRRVRFLLPRAFKQSERRAILASENRPVWTINTSKYFTLPEIIKEKFWDRRIRAMRSYPFLQYSSAPENNPFYTLASADNLLNRTAIVRVFGSMVLLTVYRHLLAASRAAPGVEGEHAMKRLMFSIERAMVNFNRSLVGETPDLGYYFQQYLGVAQPTTPDKFYPTYVRLGPTDNFFKLLRPHLQRPFSPRFDEEDRAAFAYPLKHYSGAGHSSFNFSSYYNINQLSMLNMAAAVIPLVERLPTYATPDILRAKLLALSASFAKAGARGLEGIKQLMGGLEFKGTTTPVTVRKLWEGASAEISRGVVPINKLTPLERAKVDTFFARYIWMLYYKYNVKFSRDDVLRQELVKFRDSSIRAPFFIPYRERFVNENFYAIKGRSSFYYYLQKRPFAMRKRNKAWRYVRSVAAGTVYRRADYGSPMPALSAVRIRVKATSALFRFKFYAKAILRSAFHMKARNLKTKWQKLSKSRLKWLTYFFEFEASLANMLTLVGLIPGQKLARAAVTSGFVYVNLYPMLDPEYRVRPGDAVMLRRELSIYLEGRKFHDFMRQWISFSSAPNAVKAAAGRIAILTYREFITPLFYKRTLIDSNVQAFVTRVLSALPMDPSKARVMNTWAMQSGAKSVHDHSFAALRAIDNSRFHAERQYRHIGAVANAAAKLVGAYIRDFRARGYSVSIRSDKFFIRLGRLVYIRDMPRGPNEFFQASGIPFTLIRNPAFFKLMSNHRYWY